jgi:hypothetical protein
MHHLGYEQVERSGLKKGYSLWKKADKPHPATTQPQPTPRRIIRQDRVY